MALIECPECRHQVSQHAAACPQCAHPITPPAVKASPAVPNVITVQDYQEKLRNEGLANMLQAGFALGPAIVVAGGLWSLTDHPLAVPMGGFLGFLGSWFVPPFRRFVLSRDLFVKILAAGLGAFACYVSIAEFLKS